MSKVLPIHPNFMLRIYLVVEVLSSYHLGFDGITRATLYQYSEIIYH